LRVQEPRRSYFRTGFALATYLALEVPTISPKAVFLACRKSAQRAGLSNPSIRTRCAERCLWKSQKRREFPVFGFPCRAKLAHGCRRSSKALQLGCNLEIKSCPPVIESAEFLEIPDQRSRIRDMLPRDVKHHPPIKNNDFHLIFRARSHRLICYDATGAIRWTLEAHGEGVAGSYDVPSGNTPPGLYECTSVVQSTSNDSTHDWNAYGPWYVWLQEMEGQEISRGRSGVGMHGGGSASPTPLAPKQGFYKTQGCVRLQNGDLPRLISTIRFAHSTKGRVFLTVTWTA
jgi:hypothetical protein